MDCFILSALIFLAVVALALNCYAKGPDKSGEDGHQPKSVVVENFSETLSMFKDLQRSFFLAYFPMLLADLLQGPYMYRLFDLYNFSQEQITLLFVAGYLSRITFSLLNGYLADHCGRRLSVLFNCFALLMACLAKASPDFSINLLGRVFGGLATLSMCEAWYVFEHDTRHGFDPRWKAITFSACAKWKGLLAVVAGLVSQISVEELGLGPLSPFMLAILLVVLSMVLVFLRWPENHGMGQLISLGNFRDGFIMVFEDKNILLLGLAMTAVETCMAVIVYMWTPLLNDVSSSLGLVFTCMMVAFMAGSNFFSLMQSCRVSAESILVKVTVLLFGALTVCTVVVKPQNSVPEQRILFLDIILIQFALGIYTPAMSYLRSKFIPKEQYANVMCLQMIPTNVLASLILLAVRHSTPSLQSEKKLCFFFCSILAAIGIKCATFLNVRQVKKGRPLVSLSNEV